jgi:exosortase
VAQAMVFYGVLVVVLDWGLGTTLFGLFTYAYGINPGQNDFVQHSAIVATVFGVTLLVCGWEIMKVAWFPIVFLVCAIPWPALVYSWVALPLQELAASVAAGALRVTGVEAFRLGTKLFIGDGANQRVLNVAEACAGLKSLMTFVTLAGAMGFLSSRPMWQKILITVSAVPIAILCNVFRVSGQGLLDHYVSPKWSENFAHQFAGVIMLVPAFFLLQATGWILDNVFIEEVDKRAIGERSAGKGEGLVIEIPRSAGREAAARSAQAGAERVSELAAATQRLMATVGGGRPGKAEGVSGGEKAKGR